MMANPFTYTKNPQTEREAQGNVNHYYYELMKAREELIHYDQERVTPPFDVIHAPKAMKVLHEDAKRVVHKFHTA